MKKLLKKTVLLAMAAYLLFTWVPSRADAFSPSVSTVKIGLYYGTGALPSANLLNVTGYGSGYRFGYFDSNRNFVDIGAWTSKTAISMMIDKTMYYSSSANTYYEVGQSTSNVVVGCFHIKLDSAYVNYDDARAAADTFTSVNAFPLYADGVFYVCVGAYTSRDEANAAASTLAIQQGYSVTSGTTYTVSVVETGTARVLFEFDCGSAASLAVVPMENGVKTQTWFKGYKYYGAFQYQRLSGGNLTVVNILPIEDYIKGVLPYEMSAAWPIEALKAQAVCARTYLMSHVNYHRAYGFDLCNTTDCQVYYGTNSANANSDLAVDQTAGQYLVHNDFLCETYYYSSNGGATEASGNVWAYNRPYLIAKFDPYEEDIASIASGYSWTTTYTNETLTARLRAKNYSVSNVVKFEIIEYSSVGNVLKVRIVDDNGKNITLSKERVRVDLGIKSIRFNLEGSGPAVYVNDGGGQIDGSLPGTYAIGSSGTYQIPGGSSYAITGSGKVEEIGSESSAASSGTYILKGKGSGHNVGMSQYGAYSMAKFHNLTYMDILKFYYDGTSVVTA